MNPRIAHDGAATPEAAGIQELEPGLEQELALEPERYEFREPGWDFNLGRRDFLKVLGGGLLVLCLGRDDEAQESGRPGRRGGGGPQRGGGEVPRQIDAWLHIGEDGVVTAATGKVEVGQNARTSLTQAVADELRLPIDSVRMLMGDTDHVPYDMGTFGSRTTPTMVPQLRRAAAAARSVLLKLAAETWNVDRSASSWPAARWHIRQADEVPASVS